jgi:hypothetical protein
MTTVATRGWTQRAAAALALFLSALALLLPACRNEADPAAKTRLPDLGADIAQTSVSGLSSGAYMAGQFQIAHSGIVVGAGIIAGGPYGCAESLFADVMPGPGTAFFNLSKAVNGCMLNSMQAWGIPDVERLAAKARKLAVAGRIDAIDNLLADRIYLFSGTEDRTVAPPIVAAAVRFYEMLGVPKGQIKHVVSVPAGHAIVTSGQGQACGETRAPYVENCGYDQAGDLLAHILGALEPAPREPAGDFQVFDQQEFLAGLAEPGLALSGIVYIPKACRQRPGCRVHIAFHGCGQNRALAGDAFARETGFARWADSNRLIVLFPQTDAGGLNPQGCWDWWGYTGRGYLTREAQQIVAVRRMLDRLAGRP